VRDRTRGGKTIEYNLTSATDCEHRTGQEGHKSTASKKTRHDKREDEEEEEKYSKEGKSIPPTMADFFSNLAAINMSSSPLPFSPALNQHTILACHVPFPTDYIIAHILGLTRYLISLERTGNFFGGSETSAYSPSLGVLHKRLTEGYTAPSSLPTPFLTPAHVDASTVPNAVSGPAKDRPLAHFEDLYYALLARMREMQKRMVDHLISGFSTKETTVYAGGPTIAALYTSLTSYWDVLNDASCGKAMDEAVREARVQCIHDEIVAQVRGNCVAVEDAEAQILQLRERSVYDAQAGLDWTPEWDAALVNAKLKEKYRVVFDECKRKDRMENKRIKIAQRKKREFGNGQAAVRAEAIEQRAQNQAFMDTDAAGEEMIIEVEQEPAAEVVHDEQELLWRVEQLQQHPAFGEGFSIDAQGNQEQLRHYNNAAPVQSVEEIEPAQPIQLAQDPRHINGVEHVRVFEQNQHQQELIDNGSSHRRGQGLPMTDFSSPDLYNQPAHLPQPAGAQQHQQQEANAAFYPQHSYPDRISYDLELQAQRQRVSSYTSYLREHAGEQTRAMMGYF